MPSRSELIASSTTVDEIRQYLGVESLEYLSIEDLRSVVDDPDQFLQSVLHRRVSDSDGIGPEQVRVRGLRRPH